MKESKRYSAICLWLGILFTTTLMLSNIIVQKQFVLFGLVFAASAILQPLFYVISDITSELYGYKVSRTLKMYAILINLFMVVIFTAAIKIPPAPWFQNQEAFQLVLGNTWRIVLASMTAVFIGDWLSNVIFDKMKRKHGDKGFPLRSAATSLISSLLDSAIFFLVAFLGVIPILPLLGIIFSAGLLVKVVYQLICIPFVHVLIKKLKVIEGDSYEPTDNYRIFGG